MFYTNHNLPTVNELGRQIQNEALLARVNGRYSQTDGNCFEVASTLAGLFGYQPLASRKELTDIVFDSRAETLWGDPGSRQGIRSPVCLIVRTPDNPTDMHVTLEAYGREYNYGPGTREEIGRASCRERVCQYV